jgi:histidine triad (HIT) family protein
VWDTLEINQKCIFCKIVAKQAPSSLIYEDNSVMAFLDIRPLNRGHALIIPKAHYVDIFDIPEADLKEVHAIAKRVALAVKKATNADGISVIQQNGKAAGQDIFHLHVHVVPRFEGQKLPRFSDLELAERAKLDEMSQIIKQEL